MTDDKKTRKRRLGDFGEDRARQLLLAKGFDVEQMPRNFPFFDLMAKRGSRRLLIPVKTRNKYTSEGKLKTNNYNLYTKPRQYEAAAKIAAFSRAKIAWIAVTVDTKTKTFSACMGEVSKLPSPNSIPMHPTRDVPGYERLAIDVPDAEISESWSNIVESAG
jgi:Holliday junction resolvase-like predicted endonuclease